MPPKPRITREMILAAAYAIAREQGAEQINARTISERLGCSTQPVLYHFDHIEDIRREVYRMADEYQTEYLMQLPQDQNPMTALGLNYIRFAAEEKPLFRLLCQSDSFQGQNLTALTDTPQLLPILQVFQQETELTLAQAKMVFKTLCMLVHGCASLLANNTMEYDEAEIIPMLEMAFNGMIGAMKMEESQQ
ncbi:MAG: TetR/AcrR family transcriptional regulator [Clostridia bacterium]|nr:TetR/AcrR family transcriptional regulator [Clostridia bacterium]